jgi:hypothetical protein
MAIGRGRRRELPQPTFCTTTTKKKVREKNTGKKVWEKIVRPDRASSGHVTLSLPVKKAPLGRILRKFRLRMRIAYFRTGPLPVT